MGYSVRFPPVLQAASLKQSARRLAVDGAPGFPPVLQAASLKQHLAVRRQQPVHLFSACFAGGLIEAVAGRRSSARPWTFSACFAGGLIEASGI